MSTYICKKIKTFLEIDETFVPLLNNTAHSLDYSFYSSDDWVKEACGVRWLRSGEETGDYDSFMSSCLDAATSSTPDSNWIDAMKAWVADFVQNSDKTDLALEITEKILEKAHESATQAILEEGADSETHWIPTDDTTTPPPPPPTTPGPDPTPKSDSSDYYPILVACGVASWAIPIAYYAIKKIRGE